MRGHSYGQYWHNQPSYPVHDTFSHPTEHSKQPNVYEEEAFFGHPYDPTYLHHYERSQPQMRPDQTSRFDHIRPYVMQPTGQPWPPHLNQPVIMYDPMMHFCQQRILDTGATNLLYPPAFQMFPMPMMQPYFMPTSFSNGFQTNLASAFPLPNPMVSMSPEQSNGPDNSVVKEEEKKEEEKKEEEEQQEKDSMPQPKQVEPLASTLSTQPLRRRLSLMESVLDSLSLLNETSHSKLPDQSATSSSVSSNPEPEEPAELPEETKVVDRRPSVSRKLSKKATVLQSRQYIWCYRLRNVHDAFWAAFDIKNQDTLDKQYALLVSKKQQQAQELNSSSDEVKEGDVSVIDKGVVIQKQSQITGQLMVSLSTGTAWCYQTSPAFGSDSAIVYDVASLPSQLNRLVISDKEQTNSSLRRSKSVDGFASRFLSAVLKKY